MELVTWAPHDRTKCRYQLNKLLYTVLCLPVFTGGLSWGGGGAGMRERGGPQVFVPFKDRGFCAKNSQQDSHWVPRAWDRAPTTKKPDK